MNYKRKQGDSLWMDITVVGMEEIDATWANWSGSWAVSATAGSAVLLSGTMTRSATPGLFHLRIGPGLVPGWAALPAGTYVLTAQANNATVDYRHEEQYRLVVQAQGIAP